MTTAARAIPIRSAAHLTTGLDRQLFRLNETAVIQQKKEMKFVTLMSIKESFRRMTYIDVI